jgi:hypothetical protein
VGEDRGGHRIGLQSRAALLLQLVGELDDLERERRDGQRSVDGPATRRRRIALPAAGLQEGQEGLRVLVDQVFRPQAKTFGLPERVGGSVPPLRARRHLLQQRRRRCGDRGRGGAAGRGRAGGGERVEEGLEAAVSRHRSPPCDAR